MIPKISKKNKTNNGKELTEVHYKLDVILLKDVINYFVKTAYEEIKIYSLCSIFCLIIHGKAAIGMHQ